MANSSQEKTENTAISYSIINSLNVIAKLNKNDTKKINKPLIDMNNWFHELNNKINQPSKRQNVLLLSPDDTKPFKTDEIMENNNNNNAFLSSPHKPILTLPTNENNNSALIDSETTGKQDLFITANPSPIIQRGENNIEPIPVPLNNNIQEDTSVKTEQNKPIENVHAENNDKPSPWSPFKVENTLKNVNVSINNEITLSAPTTSAKSPINPLSKDQLIPIESQQNKDITIAQSDIDNNVANKSVVKENNDKETEIGKVQSPSIANKEVKKEKVSPINPISAKLPTTENSILFNPTILNSPIKKTVPSHSEIPKSSVRVNMFAPLPEKDPLIVKNSSPQSYSSRSNNNTLKFQNITILSSHQIRSNNGNNILTDKPSLSKGSMSSPAKVNNISPFTRTKNPSPRTKNPTAVTPKTNRNIRSDYQNKSMIRNRLSPRISNKMNSPIRSLPTSHMVKKEYDRKTKSPITKAATKTPSRTSSNNNKVGGVFQRLSSIPTKSFEQKMRPRTGATPLARRFNPSSIDVTGSPIKRTSPKRKRTNQSEILEQEALNSIFFKNKAQSKRSPLKQQRSPISSREKEIFTNKGPPRKTSPKRADQSFIPKIFPKSNESTTKAVHKSSHEKNTISLIPNKIDSPTKIQTSTINSTIVHETKTLVEKTDLSPSKPVLKVTPNALKTQLTTPSTVEKAAAVSATQISLSSLNPSERIINRSGVKAIDNRNTDTISSTNKDIIKDAAENFTNKENKSKNVSSKIQLLPAGKGKKDDVKTKLNKRLSEVIRTQQEQEKKRKESQQKRKRSQLEDELKRKQTRYSTYKTQLKKSSLGPNMDHLVKGSLCHGNVTGPKGVGSKFASNNEPVFDTSNVLGDIDKVDYRNVIGEEDTSTVDKKVHPQSNNTVGEDSLPEISSDSEQDHVIMADWAEPTLLEKQLKVQSTWDPRKIFGPVAPLHIEEIFPSSSTSRLSKVKSKLTKKSTWKA